MRVVTQLRGANALVMAVIKLPPVFNIPNRHLNHEESSFVCPLGTQESRT